MNYQNNPALLITCLLGAATANSMLPAFRALDGLRLGAIRAGVAFAGETLALDFDFTAGTRARHALRYDFAGAHGAFSLAPPTGETRIAMPTERRGWQPLPRLRLSCTLPFGLFRAWGWITPDLRVLIYPRPEAAGPPPPRNLSGGQQRRRGDDELAGLRAYRVGDPLKRVAWKPSAHHGDLLVHEFDSAAAPAQWRFDWGALHGIDRETRIARLTRWIRDVHARGEAWSLRMEDGRTFGPTAGDAHFHACMTALAELPER